MHNQHTLQLFWLNNLLQTWKLIRANQYSAANFETNYLLDFNYFFGMPLQAVANSTSATFLRVVGSELIQKYLGDGPKLVRELFRVADDLSPSIVFIDEIDAVGTKRSANEHFD